MAKATTTTVTPDLAQALAALGFTSADIEAKQRSLAAAQAREAAKDVITP